MTEKERLEFMLVRYPDGQAVVEIFDPKMRRWVRLPGHVLMALQRILGTELFDLLRSVLERLPPTSHAVSFWAERPTRADRLTEQDFINSLAEQTPKLARRFLTMGDASTRPPSTVHLSVEDLRDCVDHGLHTWRMGPLGALHCSVCRGTADRLIPPSHLFEVHLSELIIADPWRTLEGRGLRPGRSDHPETPLRLVLDAEALSNPSRDDESVLRYLVRRAPKQSVLLRLAGSRVTPPLDEIPKVEVSVTADNSGRRHLTGALRAGSLEPRNFALGTEAELAGLAGRLGGGEAGARRARTIGLGRDFEALIVTTDHHFLGAC